MWTWSVMNVVCFERGLLWMWSVMNGSVMIMVCYEHGLLWTGLLWTWSVFKCGPLWTWSVIKVVCYEWGSYERVCYERGLLWTRSVMNGSVMSRSVTNVVCFEWSVVIGLIWTGRFWKGTYYNTALNFFEETCKQRTWNSLAVLMMVLKCVE